MTILNFQMPQKVLLQKGNNFYGTFEFGPLEKGYGVTIGNTIRRVLLSSLEGYAITNIKINNVLHEFSTIKGVVQDMTEFILNLKEVRFKYLTQQNQKTQININIKNQSVFKAGNINKFTNQFKVLNPEVVVCELDPKTELNLQLNIEKGRGYLTAEDNKPLEQIIGLIPIDSIFTPIVNVKYKVENTRVEQRTDYEKLILSIQTDGSISPEAALREASNIMIKHLLLFSDQNILLPKEKEEIEETIDEDFLRIRKLLKTPMGELDLSVRAANCLKAANIQTLGELAALNIQDMMKFRNFGKKSLMELEEIMREKNLYFGMDTLKYNLNQD